MAAAIGSWSSGACSIPASAAARRVDSHCASWNIAGTVITAARRGLPSARSARLRQRPQHLGGQLFGRASDGRRPGTISPALVPICRLNSTAVSSGWCETQPQRLARRRRTLPSPRTWTAEGKQYACRRRPPAGGASRRPARRSPSCSFRGRCRSRSSLASRLLRGPGTHDSAKS